MSTYIFIAIYRYLACTFFRSHTFVHQRRPFSEADVGGRRPVARVVVFVSVRFGSSWLMGSIEVAAAVHESRRNVIILFLTFKDHLRRLPEAPLAAAAAAADVVGANWAR